MDIQISPIPFLSDNYAWLLHDRKNAVIVDPGPMRASGQRDFCLRKDAPYESHPSAGSTITAFCGHVKPRRNYPKDGIGRFGYPYYLSPLRTDRLPMPITSIQAQSAYS